MRYKICILLLAVLALISGCVKIQIKEIIDSSGKSDFSMIMEPLNRTLFGWDKKNPCDDFKPNETSALFTSPKCKFDGKREIISGKFDRKTAGGLTISGSRYRFDLIKALDGFNDKKDDTKTQMKLQEHKNLTQIRQMREQGVVYDYIVKLPGKVTSKSGCSSLPDGSVRFDLLELEQGDNPYVESETSLLGGIIRGGDMSENSKSTSNINGDKSDSGSKGLIGKLSSTCIPGLTLLGAGISAALSKIF